MESIVTLIVGALICFFGVKNMTGDISSLHSYHRSRVSPEDVKPFGKMVGLGTLLCGVGVLIMSAFSFIASISGIDALVIVGTVLMMVVIVVGCVISFYAMKKYNGGIF